MLRDERRILVVGGNQGEAEHVAGVLERAGFDVTVAADPAAALASSGAGPGFDLLLTDVAVTGMPGCELARLARREWPALRVLYMSEHAPASDFDRGHEEFIRKPFDAIELVGCVFEILTRDAGGHPARGRPPRAPADAAAAGPWCPVRRPAAV